MPSNDVEPLILKCLSDRKEKTVEGVIKQLTENETPNTYEPLTEDVIKQSLTNLLEKKYITLCPPNTYKITDDGMKCMENNLSNINYENSSSFFDYLNNIGLLFDTQTVEDFLLSLKAKQFLILSGGTGTGKTQLAKAYGEYISSSKPKTVDVTITIGKGPVNNGFTLSRDQFLSGFPASANKLDGEYDFSVDGIAGKAKIVMTPRFWFDRDDPNREQILHRLEEIKKDNDKTTLSITVPSSDMNSKSYLIVPVGSNWTDNRHILGYHNAITNKYSRTPTLDLLIKSNRDITHPSILILDEMNLSHVERYFSDIISSMESKVPILIDSVSDDVPKEIDLDDNLFIIGTVNMDETTYTFSPKVLDRSNVIEFECTPVSKYLGPKDNTYAPSGDVEFLQDCMSGLECRNMKSNEIIEKMRSQQNNGIISSLISDLESIQRIMNNMKLPFGFRTVDEVMRFMYVAWIYEGRGQFTNWKRYMDSQIKQKIIPKIHGNQSIREALEELESFCIAHDYPRSSAKLKRMKETLDAQRYVSFNV